MIQRMRLLAIVAFATAVSAAVAQERKDEKPFDDTVFVKTAASSGMAEVEISKLAVASAKNPDVKKFAEMLVKDHTKAGEELKAAAKAANIVVPDKVSDEHQKHIDMFKNYKGDNFDRDYLKHMIDGHTQSVTLYTRASKEAKNADIKDFATKTLPVIQAHLDAAKKLQQK